MSQAGSRKKYPFDSPGNYRICVQGLLHESWSDRLGGLQITKISQKNKAPGTELVGQMRDQAELAGVCTSCT